MLKLKLDKAAHATLPADLQKEYKANGDDEFVLETDVKFEDVAPLKNALKEEKKHRKEATEKVTALEESVATLTEEKEKLEARGQKPSDLEKSWQVKVDKIKADADKRTGELTTQLRTLLVDNVATTMAGEISISPQLMLPHLKNRLAIEETDGKFITRVLDSEGKASALSVNELKAEILADKQFAPIIKASNASGGGASGGSPPAGGKAFKDMNEAEKVALYRANPTEFERQKTAAGF
jgi:hypothetical protein